MGGHGGRKAVVGDTHDGGNKAMRAQEESRRRGTKIK